MGEYATDDGFMRTTIEIAPVLHARVLELAADRSDKGFSNIVAEALELYLETQSKRIYAVQNAFVLKGSMRGPEAAALTAKTRKIRENRR
jgi:hypothetical protein